MTLYKMIGNTTLRIAGAAPQVTVHFRYSLVAARVMLSAPRIVRSGPRRAVNTMENRMPLSNCFACLYFFVLLFKKRGNTYVCIYPSMARAKPAVIAGICGVGTAATIIKEIAIRTEKKRTSFRRFAFPLP